MSDAAADRTRRVLDLFRRACDLSPGERGDLLDDECGADADLRAEVEALLAEDDAEHPTFADEAIAARGAELERVLGEPDAAPLPESVGGYRIVRLIGAGGMGVVFEAEQVRPRRRVAVKLAHPTLAAPDRIERFWREAELLGRLGHPGIARIFEAGVDNLGQGTQPFLVMELIEGRDLVRFADEEQLDREARLKLFLRVCDAVQHAHDSGVVHRDLKPDNILVRADGQPVVLDFGVARATEGDVRLATQLTSAGHVIGTLAYMSPEQASGAPDVGAPSDVFALGALLFELLAGTPPHALSGLTLPAALHRVQAAEPRRLAAVDSSLRGDLDTIATKALERVPGRRYSSAADLARDVQRHLRSEPIQARPPSAVYQLSKLARRHRAAFAGATLAGLSLLVGSGAALAFAVRALDKEREARLEAYIGRIEAAHASLAREDPRRARLSLEAIDADQRGWEWRHLWSRVVGESERFEGRVESFSTLAFAPELGRVAGRSGSDLNVWDLDTGALVASHRQGVELTCVAARIAAGAVLVGTADGRVRRVDLESGAVVLEQQLPRAEPVVAVDQLASGAVAAAATGAAIFEVGGAAPRPVFELSAGTRVGDLRMPPDGRGVLYVEIPRAARAARAAGRLVLRALDGGELITRRSALEVGLLTCPTIAPDGRRVAVGGRYGISEVVALDGLATERRMGNHSPQVVATGWSRAGDVLATLAADGSLCLRDASTGDPFRILELGALDNRGRSDRVGECLVLDGGRVLTAVGGELRAWSTVDRSATVLRGHTDYVYNVRFLPDGQTLISRSFEDELFVWDVLEGRPLGSARQARGQGLMALSSELVVVGSPGVPRTLDLATLARVEGADAEGAVLVGPGRALSPDRTLLGRARQSSVVDLATREVRYHFGELGDQSLAHGIEFHPSEPLVVHTSDRIRVFELTTGRPHTTVDGHSGAVYCAAFSPDGLRLATGGIDGTVAIWETASMRLLVSLVGHDNYVRALAWSPDGSRLASGSGDGTIRLWDSVPAEERQAELAVWQALKRSVRPAVQAALDAHGSPDAAAAALRAEPRFADEGEERTAMLRVLLELSASD